MSNMYFQNLPNTSTPITAENLNKLNDVKVSRTQPTTGEKVWLTYTSNIISLLNGTYTDNGITATVSNNTITLNGTATATSFVRIPLNNLITLKANTNYTFSANNTESYGASGSYASIRLHKTDNSDDAGTDVTFTNINSSNVITKDTTTSYLKLTVRTGSGIAYNNALIKPQLELGGSKTTYEPYVEKNIYVKNNNNIYEIYSPKTQTIKLPTSSITNLNGTVATNSTYKLEGLVGVNLKISGVTISSTGSASTVATFPAGFYPTGECSLIAYSPSGQLIPAWIGTTGNIRLSPTSTLNNTEIRILGSYYVY